MRIYHRTESHLNIPYNIFLNPQIYKEEVDGPSGGVHDIAAYPPRLVLKVQFVQNQRGTQASELDCQLKVTGVPNLQHYRLLLTRSGTENACVDYDLGSRLDLYSVIARIHQNSSVKYSTVSLGF